MQTSHIEPPSTDRNRMDPAEDTARKCLEVASSNLAVAASKLTIPTPEMIREVQGLIEASNSHVESAVLAPGTLTSDDVKSFRNVCQRVSRLLEGACVGQWNQLRQMGDYLETYQANGSIRDCSVRSSSIDTTG